MTAPFPIREVIMDNDLGRRFQAELQGLARTGPPESADPPGLTPLGLTPSELSRAAVTAIGVDGAGLTLLESRLRLPLGASSPTVELAEQLQATLGDGPCLQAAELGAPQIVPETELAARWTVYHQALVQQTPFRSVVAVPLRDGDGVFGSLNLYLADPVPDGLPSAEDIDRQVGVATAALLAGIVIELGDVDLWTEAHLEHRLGSAGPGRRLQVWTAVGLLMQAGDLGDADAIALLRGYAFTQGLSLDEVGRQLVHRELGSAEVLEAG